MTSSAKPEVHNILQRRQRGPSHGHKQDAHKIERSWDVWFLKYPCRQADRHLRIDTLIIILSTHAEAE